MGREENTPMSRPPQAAVVSTEACIECDDVWKTFGDPPADVLAAARRRDISKDEMLRVHNTVVAVAGVSFSVRRGEIFCVMGLSGSGKSTLIRCLNGLVVPTMGRVRILGNDLATISASRLRALRSAEISMVFQHVALLPHRTVLENAAFGLELRRMPREERERRAQRALDTVRLSGWEKKYTDELSGGMQQRVGLARAIAGGAGILLMDEPFSALDPIIRRELQDEFRVLTKTLGATAVFITHDFDEAVRAGDRMAIMKDGEIVQMGSPQEIVLNPVDDYVAAFAQEVDRTTVLRACDIMRPPNAVPAVSLGRAVSIAVTQDTGLGQLIALDAQPDTIISVTDNGIVTGTITLQDLLRAMRKPGRTSFDEVLK